MKLTIEELRKVYSEESLKSWTGEEPQKRPEWTPWQDVPTVREE